MTQKHDGGSAYPADDLSDIHGMSLRDAAAIAALPAIIKACKDDTRTVNETHAEMVARKSFEVADAFIAARAIQ